MKRVASLLMTCIILLGCINTALADDFLLRNGIQFGDDLDTVKSKETLTITSSSVDKTNKVFFSGKIAGIDGSVRYDFDEEKGTLVEVAYQFDSTTSKDTIDSNYSTLYQSLVRKYGKPLGNTGGSLHTIVGSAVMDALMLISLYNYIGKGDYRDYDEWIVNCDDYNVKIDLFSFYTRDSDYNYKYYNYLSYHYYTDQDLLDEIQQMIDENAAIDNDL